MNNQRAYQHLAAVHARLAREARERGDEDEASRQHELSAEFAAAAAIAAMVSETNGVS